MSKLESISSGTVHITRTVIGDDGSVRREMRFRTPTSDAAAADPPPHHRRASTTATPSASDFTSSSSSSGLGPPRTRPAQRSHSTSRVRPNTFSSSSSASSAAPPPQPPSSSSYSRPTARVPPSSRPSQPTPNSTQPNSFPSKDFSSAASSKAQNEEFNMRTAAAASSIPRGAPDGGPTSPRGRSVPSYQQPTVSSVRRGRNMTATTTTTPDGGTPGNSMGSPRATPTQSSDNAMPSPSSRHHQGRGLDTMPFFTPPCSSKSDQSLPKTLPLLAASVNISMKS